MGYIVEFPEMNELKFAPEGEVLPARYHYQQDNRDWHYNLLMRFQRKNNYKQRKQNKDYTCIQLHTDNASAGMKLEIWDCNANVIDSSVVTPSVQAFSGNTYNSIQLNTIQWFFRFFDTNVVNTQGVYYCVVIEDLGGGSNKYYISEPIWVRNDWKDTILIEYTHDKNDHGIFFSLNTRFQIRVPGYIIYDDTESADTKFKNQDNVQETLSVDTTLKYCVEVHQIPRYLVKKLHEAFKCSEIAIERVKYEKDGNWEFDKNHTASLVSGNIIMQMAKPSDATKFTKGTILNLLPASNYPYYVSSLLLYAPGFGNVYFMQDSIIEDGTGATAAVTAMNTLLGNIGSDSLVSISGSNIILTNATGEAWILLQNTYYLKSCSIALNQSTLAAVFKFRYRSTSGFGVDWGDGSLATLPYPAPSNPGTLTATHTYANGATGTETVRIFHSDNISQFDIIDSANTSRLTGITGAMSSQLKVHNIISTILSSTTNWDYTYLQYARITLETLVLTGTPIVTLNSLPFNISPVYINNYHNLKTIALGNNKLSSAAIATLLDEFVGYCNYSFNGVSPGFLYVKDQTPAAPLTGTAPANKVLLQNAGWTVYND